MAFITVKHNIEVAHRLHELEGNKCQNIHGHSMWIELSLRGQANERGILEGLEFSEVKKLFRTHLDTHFDHRLLLNEKDPLAKASMQELELPTEGISDEDLRFKYEVQRATYLPGLVTTPGDPTTENIAKWIAGWAYSEWKLPTRVLVQETHVNGAVHDIEWTR